MTAASDALDPIAITVPLDHDADYLTICFTWQHPARTRHHHHHGHLVVGLLHSP